MTDTSGSGTAERRRGADVRAKRAALLSVGVLRSRLEDRLALGAFAKLKLHGAKVNEVRAHLKRIGAEKGLLGSKQ